MPPSPRRPPNGAPSILLITTDEQRYDTLGSTSGGRVRTPNLDALAARGTRFTRGYIQNPVCIPSRACIMTGRYVHQHGVDHMQPEIGTTPGLPPWEPAVMERLQEAGYRTAAFGKIHMMPPRGLDEMALTMGKGARWTVSSGSPLGPSQLGPVYAAWLEGKRPGAYEEIYAQRREPEYREQAGAVVNCLAADEYVDYWIGENTWQYLERLADTPERPFFAWCGFCGPHPPFDPPQPYASMYPIDEMPVPELLRERQRNVPRSDRPGRFDGEDGEPLIRKLTAYYWGMMTFIDDMLGRIMEVLTRRGLWEHTLVIFTTDHGAMLGDFGLMGKGNFREQVIRVPYLVVPAGTSPAALPSGARTGRGASTTAWWSTSTSSPPSWTTPGWAPPRSCRGRACAPSWRGAPRRSGPGRTSSASTASPRRPEPYGASSACARSATSTSSPLRRGRARRPLWSCTTCRRTPRNGLTSPPTRPTGMRWSATPAC